MVRLLTGLLWLMLASGVFALLWSQRERLGLNGANEPGEPACYRWAFYVNPRDTRLFVRDLTGVGWTVNLAHRAAMGVLLAACGAPFAVLFVVGALHG